MANTSYMLGTSYSNQKNAFPVRPLIKQSDEGDGAWLVAKRAEQRKRLKVVIHARPSTIRTTSSRRSLTKAVSKAETASRSANKKISKDDSSILDGFLLCRHCNVDDPSNLCDANISGLYLTEAKDEDFEMFDSLARINGAENMLPLECFNNFRFLHELELPLNGLSNLHIEPGFFPHLEYLDLSYNSLSATDVFNIGLITSLKRLHLTGNGFRSLPEDLAVPNIDEEGNVHPRFVNLEVMMLDDNRLSDVDVFVTLATLPRLRILSLEHNEITLVPGLRTVAGRAPSVVPPSELSTGRSTARDDGGGSGRRHKKKEKKKSAGGSDNDADDASASSSRRRRRAENQAAAGGKSTTSSGKRSGKPLVDLPTEDLTARVDLIQQRLLELSRPESAPLVAIATSVEDGGGSTVSLGPTGRPRPLPFPCLRSVNLAHNRIATELDVVAVAGWPALAEILLHDNPLTRQHSGDPPLLRQLLMDRLNINIIRLRPPSRAKPSIVVPRRRDRTIRLRVPPIPRLDVAGLLTAAIEAPPDPVDPDPEPPQLGSAGRGRGSQPLPAIRSHRDDSDTSPWDDNEKEEEEETFFMTQVNSGSDKNHTPSDGGEDMQKPLGGSDVTAPTAIVSHNNGSLVVATKLPAELRQRVAGYEDLFVDATENDVNAASSNKDTMQSDLRSLEYMLKHPLTFNERTVRLDQPQADLHVTTRRISPPPPPRRNRAEEVAAMLRQTRTTEFVAESDLTEVLRPVAPADKAKAREAQVLLNQIQRKYNSVRSKSIKKAKSESSQNMAAMVDDIRSEIKKHLEDN